MTMADITDPMAVNRRYFFSRTSTGIGALALSSLLGPKVAESADLSIRGIHHLAKARRVIYLFQSGGPSQLDTFDYKPGLVKYAGKEVPKSVYPDDRKTTMSAGQSSFATQPTAFKFKQHGKSGAWMNEHLPYTGLIADDICIVKSLYTEAINHDPAITFLQTGSQIAGRPSMGAWLNYGLGSENEDLPAFVAMSSRGGGGGGQPLYDRLWGSGFMPAEYQGVKFRNQGQPVLDIHDPPGVNAAMRRRMLDTVGALNQAKYDDVLDPTITSRIAQYELAYRMQSSVPELVDFSKEPEHVYKLYGQDAKKVGTYAYNCLMARRLVERGVRFIQLYHQGWDHHNNLNGRLPALCKTTDQASAALIHDLKQRGLLDDTLVIWGGEFGRTVYAQKKKDDQKTYGRDHHPGCLSVWLAGGGIKPGMVYGETDDYSVNVAKDGVHVHDLQATILHLMGIDHERLTYKFQGRHYRLTDVHGHAVKPILA
jgi:uncharacterized protein (DUF1501 family)